MLRSSRAGTGPGRNGRWCRCWRDSRAPCGARVYLCWMRLGGQRRMAWSCLARRDVAWILRMVRNLRRMDIASSSIRMYWLLSARPRRARQVHGRFNWRGWKWRRELAWGMWRHHDLLTLLRQRSRGLPLQRRRASLLRHLGWCPLRRYGVRRWRKHVGRMVLQVCVRRLSRDRIRLVWRLPLQLPLRRYLYIRQRRRWGLPWRCPVWPLKTLGDSRPCRRL